MIDISVEFTDRSFHLRADPKPSVAELADDNPEAAYDAVIVSEFIDMVSMILQAVAPEGVGVVLSYIHDVDGEIGDDMEGDNGND